MVSNENSRNKYHLSYRSMWPTENSCDRLVHNKGFLRIQLASLATFEVVWRFQKTRWGWTQVKSHSVANDITIGAGTWGHRQKSIHFVSAESRDLSWVILFKSSTLSSQISQEGSGRGSTQHLICSTKNSEGESSFHLSQTTESICPPLSCFLPIRRTLVATRRQNQTWIG